MEQASALVSTIPLIHLHGALGSLAERQYGPELTAHGVHTSVKAMKIVHEEVTDTYAQAIDLIQGSQQVCFLGFGYHPINVERLRVRKWGQQLKLYGTCLGFTIAERTAIHQRLASRPIEFGHPNHDALSFLREYDLLS